MNELDALKARHRGERCFILGSGPSIKNQDLTRLEGSHLFCANLFIQHPHIQRLQPAYYCAYDEGLITPEPNRRWLALLAALPATLKFFPESFRRLGLDLPNTIYLPFEKDRAMPASFPIDPRQTLGDGGSVVVNLCLPLAVYLGFREIYLLGCECDYGIAASGTRDHTYFYDSAQHVPRFHTPSSEQRWQQRVHGAFAIAQKTLEPLGIQVYNATPGGCLDVFPRVVYEQVTP